MLPGHHTSGLRDSVASRWSLSGALCAVWVAIFGLACADVLLDGGRGASLLPAALYGLACVACLIGARHSFTKSRRRSVSKS